MFMLRKIINQNIIKMKHKLLYLLSLFLLMPFGVQSQEAPQHRVVYLWDVTYSMHGGQMGGNTSKPVPIADGENVNIEKYNPKYDIYDEILMMLIQKIQEQNDTTEIVIVPFTNKVIASSVWRERATQEGKNKLIQKIRKFKHIDQEHTNIHGAFDFANTLFDGSKFPRAKHQSELYIFTDGEHNYGGKEGKKKFYAMLRSWCEQFASKYNVKGYYFLLTDQAIKDKELEKILNDDNSCGCIEVNRYFEKHFFDIRGNKQIPIKEDYGKSIQLNVVLEDVDKKITEPVHVRIWAEENPYFNLDEIAVVDGSASFEVKPQYIKTLSELQELLPTDRDEKVLIHFEQLNPNNVNQLRNNSCEWSFKNKTQKILIISIK